MGGQLFDPIQSSGQGAAGLEDEPFVDHQGIVAPAVVEIGQQFGAGLKIGVDHTGQGGDGVGHVVAGPVLPDAELEEVSIDPAIQVRSEQVGQTAVAQGPSPGLLGAVPVGAVSGQCFMAQTQFGGQGAADQGAKLLADLENGHRVDDRHLLADPVLRRQGQGQGEEGGIGNPIEQQVAQAVHQKLVDDNGFAPPEGLDLFEEKAQGQFLAGIPAIEGIRVMGHQPAQLLVALIEAHLDRRGESAQEGDGRRRVEVRKDVGLAPLGKDQGPGVRIMPITDRDRPAIGVEQSHGQWHEKRFFFRGFPGGRAGLVDGQGQLPPVLVVLGPDGQLRGAGLGVPPFKLAQVVPPGTFHGGDKVIAGHGLAVVAFEIDIHAPPEGSRSEQGMEHADHLGALVVDGQRVEVVDLDKGGRPHRMGHGTGILAELEGADDVGVLNPFHRPGDGISGEFLVAEHGQSLLETQLEPIAAGDPVAGPVVKVLVGDHRLDAFVIDVGGGFGQGEHILGVEHVQPLVLHGAHVEIVDRHDHVGVKVVFAAEPFFVPAHGLLE